MTLRQLNVTANPLLVDIPDVNTDNFQVCHITGTCATPTFTPGAGSGANPAVTIIGTDLAGYIKINPTVDGVGGTLGTLNFTTPYGFAPVVVISPANQNAATIAAVPQAVFADSVDVNSFRLSMFPFASTLQEEAGQYIWVYHVLGNPI
jgi:hypothetical protein